MSTEHYSKGAAYGRDCMTEAHLEQQVTVSVEPNEVACALSQTDGVEFIVGMDDHYSDIAFTAKMIRRVLASWEIPGFEALAEEFEQRIRGTMRMHHKRTE